MTELPNSLFVQVAREVVPHLRRAMTELGMPPECASPTMSMTATIEVEGQPARVRVEVTLDPDEEDGANDVFSGDPE